MISAENIEKLVKKLRYQSSDDGRKRIFDDVTAVLDDKQKRKPAMIRPNRWRIIMKSRITKYAAAAAIIVSVLTGIYQLTGSIDGASKVYAAAIKALENVNTVHITGWTSRLYPHTIAGEKLSESQQYPVNIWGWNTETNEYREYDHQGPLIVWDNGNRSYEYQAYKETLFISKSYASKSSLLTKFNQISERLSLLKERGVDIENIGTRSIEGKLAVGYRVEKNDKRDEIWIDTQEDLPIEENSYWQKEGQWVQWRHGVISYDEIVPINILAYTPPETEKVDYDWDIDPRFEKWHLHLQKIAAYYQQHPLPTTMELLPRENDETMEAYSPGRLPGITSETRQWALSIQSSLGDFLLRYRPRGTIYVPNEFKSIQLNHDLITSNDITSNQRVRFVLDALGYELLETTEERTVWIAHYDGRPLKPWKEVKAPVPNPQNVPFHPGMASGSGLSSMQDLFDDFVYYQNYDLTAKGLIIIDETGLPNDENTDNYEPEKYAVCNESIVWHGNKSIEIAKKWFNEQFGVTFTEEIRPIKTYIVQEKTDR